MSIKVKCECSQIMTLLQYSNHCDTCAASRNKFKNEEKAKDKNNEINPDKRRIFRQTFDCTLCKAKNLNRTGYIEHISNSHRDEKGVCAICKNQLCEEQNSIINIYEHINNIHIFNYENEKSYSDY